MCVCVCVYVCVCVCERVCTVTVQICHASHYDIIVTSPRMHQIDNTFLPYTALVCVECVCVHICTITGAHYSCHYVHQVQYCTIPYNVQCTVHISLLLKHVYMHCILHSMYYSNVCMIPVDIYALCTMYSSHIIIIETRIYALYIAQYVLF